MAVEARSQFGERWGVVAFLDGGMAYEESTPGDNPPLQWGAGVGLRVFTGLGPVRLDVAVPVNPREALDDDYQFYISLGQAF
jgi:translocation and assembly module TamA